MWSTSSSPLVLVEEEIICKVGTPKSAPLTLNHQSSLRVHLQNQLHTYVEEIILELNFDPS